jgi:hypothetical protein
LLSRRTALKIGAGLGLTAIVGPLPDSAEAKQARGRRGGGSYPFAITGSATFVSNIRAGLDLMRAAAPTYYNIIAGYVTQIREGAQNYSWGGSTVIQISGASAAISVTYTGSIVLHEADHVKNWFTGNFPVYGCEGEAKSLRVQAAYLYAVGDVGMARWVESQIGVWC